jgi:soluble lytic murein transglycosylase-like protein
VTPSIHDVVGTPVPGSGLVRRPPERGAAFRGVIESLLKQHGASKSAPTQRTSAVHHVRSTLPARGLRSSHVLPQATRQRHVHGATPARARTSGARSATGAADRAALAGSIRQAAADAGVEPALSVAVARAESGLNPKAVSHDGVSVGTFQVTHATRAEMHRKFARGVVARPSGSDDVATGVGYLRYLNDVFSRGQALTHRLATTAVSDPAERSRFVAAAYNAGEGRVAGAQARAAAAGLDPTRFASIERMLPRSTQAYVDRVQRYASEESAGATSVG